MGDWTWFRTGRGEWRVENTARMQREREEFERAMARTLLQANSLALRHLGEMTQSALGAGLQAPDGLRNTQRDG